MSAPKTTPAMRERLIAHLLHRQAGASAATMATVMFGAPTESNKRRIRSLASEASPVIISAPDIGYRHACHATDEQLMAAENSLRSQAAKMMARATKIAEMRRNRVQPLLAL